jgi:hypothetical protein
MACFDTKKFTKYDDYMTPKQAWENINHLIPKNKVIWEPFYGDGTSGQFLTELGHTVIHETIDFFENDKGEIIITNPPFTMKKEVLQRLKLLDKPFILICPMSMLNTNYYREAFGDLCQIVIPRRRIQFIKMCANGELKAGGQCNFDCAYFCYKMNLERDIIFL